MFLVSNQGAANTNNRVAVVKDADGIISGQIVKLTSVNGTLYMEKTVSGDTASTCELAVAWVDITDNTRRTLVNTSLTSQEWDKVAYGKEMIAIQGKTIVGRLSQLPDGNYAYGTKLTLDAENACFKRAGSEDTVYGKVIGAGMISTNSESNKEGMVEVQIDTIG